MGKTVQITCDGCGADITTTVNSVDYRLVLFSERKQGDGSGMYTDMMKYPALDRSYYFCGIACLDHWRDRERHEAKLNKAWWDNWKEHNGTKTSDGQIISFIMPSDEMHKTRMERFKAEALTAFPLERLK